MTTEKSERAPHGRSLMAKKPGAGRKVKPASQEGQLRSFAKPESTRDREQSAPQSHTQGEALAAPTEGSDERKADAGEVVHALNPKLVGHGPFANRLNIAYEDEDFEDILADIRAKGRNEIAGKVRPVDGGRYEIVYGHRRHAACLGAGVPFYAIVEEMSDMDMLEKMTVENDLATTPSPFELALRYRDWVDENNVWPNYTELGKSLGKSQAYIGQRVSILSLPQEVLLALGDPRLLSITEWRKLVSLNSTDAEELLTVAREINSGREEYAVTDKATVKKRFNALLNLNAGTPNVRRQKAESHATKSGRSVFTHKVSNGKLQITLDRSLPDEIQKNALEALEIWFQENVG